MVVAALRKVGCVVVVLDDADFDLLVGFGGRWVCVEVKDGDLSPSRRELTTNERAFQELCRDRNLPWLLVEGVTDAVDLVNSRNTGRV